MKLWEIRALARALLSLARLISEASLPRYSDETGGGARGWGRIRVKFELKSSQIQMRSRIRLLWGARRRERSGGRGATGMAGS